MGTVVSLDRARARRSTDGGAEARAVIAARAAAAVTAGARLLTADELGAELHCSRWTIRDHRRAGMPAHPIGGAGYRYILSEVLQWHRERREGPGATHGRTA